MKIRSHGETKGNITPSISSGLTVVSFQVNVYDLERKLTVR